MERNSHLVGAMKNLLAVFFAFCACILSAQTEPVYNPDFNSDSFISAPDLVSFLPFFGQPFTPFSLSDPDEVTIIEHTFSSDFEHAVLDVAPAVILRQDQCGTSNSGAGINCTGLEVEFNLTGSYLDFYQMRVFNAGTIYPDNPNYYSNPVETFSFGQQLIIYPNEFLTFVHFQGQWFVQNGPTNN